MSDSYQAAWAYLQGAVETLVALVPDLAPNKTQERLQRALEQAWRMVPNGYATALNDEEPAQQPLPPEIPGATLSGTSGGVYFPHDLRHSGDGTFTQPGPSEDEIAELMAQRYPERVE